MHRVLFFFFTFLPFLVEASTVSHPSKGTIILLNGPSASGKTSIQKEIQAAFKELYLKVGIDSFFDSVLPTPDISQFEKTKEIAQYTNDHILIRKITLMQDFAGSQIVPLEIGPAGDHVIFGMNHAFAAYADQGNNLVIDYILYKPEWLLDLVQALKGYKVYLIGIHAPLAWIEERERARGTSPVGHARSHYNIVHKNMIYDLEIDVSNFTPQQSAEKIKQFVEKNPNPMALKKLSEQFNR